MVKRRYYYVTKKDKQDIMYLLPSEEFRPIPGYPGFFASQYGRIMSKRQNKAKIVKQYSYKGYWAVNTRFKRHGKYREYILYTHKAVALAFCSKPTWAKPGDKLQVHHIKPVDTKRQICINTATNLEWVPTSIHGLIHRFPKIEILIGGEFVLLPLLTACERLGITPYEIKPILDAKSTTDGDYQVYQGVVERPGESDIHVHVRVKTAAN